MPRRPIAKANTKAATKANRKAMTPEQKAYRRGYRDGRKVTWTNDLDRRKALEDKVVEQARHITNQERTIAGLLSLLNNSPDGA